MSATDVIRELVHRVNNDNGNIAYKELGQGLFEIVDGKNKVLIHGDLTLVTAWLYGRLGEAFQKA